MFNGNRRHVSANRHKSCSQRVCKKMTDGLGIAIEPPNTQFPGETGHSPMFPPTQANESGKIH